MELHPHQIRTNLASRTRLANAFQFHQRESDWYVQFSFHTRCEASDIETKYWIMWHALGRRWMCCSNKSRIHFQLNNFLVLKFWTAPTTFGSHFASLKRQSSGDLPHVRWRSCWYVRNFWRKYCRLRRVEIDIRLRFISRTKPKTRISPQLINCLFI